MQQVVQQSVNQPEASQEYVVLLQWQWTPFHTEVMG